MAFIKRKDNIVWTEKTIQDELYKFCVKRHHELVIPNIYLLYSESDLISVTKNGTIFEYEIKCTRADFRNERKKARYKNFKYLGNRYKPSFFWYVAPPGVIPKDELPEWAGLMECHEGHFSVVKPAPRIHNDTITEDKKKYIYRGLTHRYWNTRTKK